MTQSELKEIVISSLSILCEKDSILIDNSVKEECINHKLAQYIEKIIREKVCVELNGIDVDVEYNKYDHDPKKMMGQTPIRPDIIVHRRQSGNADNYLAIEAKKLYSSRHDRLKINHLVTSNYFNYSLGCLISYQPDRKYLIVEFLGKGNQNWEKQKFQKRPFQLI